MLLADSITQDVEVIPGLDIVTMPGQTPLGCESFVKDRGVPIEKMAVVGFAIGTNRLDWSRNRWSCQPENLAEQVLAEVRQMVQVFRKYNPKAFVILFTVIPRPRDHAQTHRAVQVFNKLLFHECKRSRYGYASTWKLFAEKQKGPAQPRSKRHQEMPPIIPRKDLFRDGLHLNRRGSAILRDRIKEIFDDKSLVGSGKAPGMMFRSRWRLEGLPAWKAARAASN